MKIDSIKNGIVLDHITAGKSLEVYKALGLDKLDCSVAIIKNVKSNKMGKKDILKIKEYLDYAKSIDLNIIIGGGVNLDNLITLAAKTDITQIHIGSAAKINKNPILDLDPEAVQKIRDIIHSR